MSFTTRPILESDYPEVDRILQNAFEQPTFMPWLPRLCSLQQDGWLVVQEGDIIVGCGGITIMGSIAYIALIATEPQYQHRGVATHLMGVLVDFGIQHGCSTILLDATASGKPVYERLNFVVEDEVAWWKYTSQNTLALPSDKLSLVPFHHINFAEVAAFDARGYGANREHVLATYFEDDPSFIRLVRDEAGQLQGYMLVQAETHVVGPWMATSPEAAYKLLTWCLTNYRSLPPEVVVSSSNSAATELLKRSGFEVMHRYTHMRSGTPLDPARRQAVFGQINPGLG
jgi:ribosomal protein S18 acetylase RimI-like enzyme